MAAKRINKQAKERDAASIRGRAFFVCSALFIVGLLEQHLQLGTKFVKLPLIGQKLLCYRVWLPCALI